MHTDETAKNRIFLSPPHMGGREVAMIEKAFKSNYIAPNGPMVDQFETDFAKKFGFKKALAVASGTAAMHLSLRALGVKAGDEVLASTLTFIGSVSPILFQGATPVFIDSDITTWNMDCKLLESELKNCAARGTLPKAIIPTDLYGQSIDIDKIVEIGNQYNVPVIIDSAEALGSKYKNRNAGNGAKISIFSFNGNKIITTSSGGMIASDDEKIIDYARKLSQQAREPYMFYEHLELGYNYRMSNILAAIGIEQLNVLSERVRQKREIFNFYRQELFDLPGLEFMPEASYGESNRWLTVVLIDPEEFGTDRNEIYTKLEKENIESRPIWKPMHMQPLFHIVSNTQAGKDKTMAGKSQYDARAIGGEVSEYLFQRGLCLPSGTAMTNNDLMRVVKIIRSSCRQ